MVNPTDSHPDTLDQLAQVQSHLDAIEIIEQHYPADHPKLIKQIPGERLLMRALCACWRDLPEPVLRHYARLCIQESLKKRHLEFIAEQRVKK